MKTSAGPIKVELGAIAVLILVANLRLFAGSMAGWFIFMPDRVLAGEWWRVFTHPFIHVSWYHLLLDAAAFLLLYAEFPNWSRAKRLGATAACGAGSLIAALTSPMTAEIGLCGLSGIAHGLAALAALQMMHRNERMERLLGTALLLGLVGKTLLETVTGQAALSLLHFGSVGIPITACHAGGVLAGLMFALLSSSSPISLRFRVGYSAKSSFGIPVSFRFRRFGLRISAFAPCFGFQVGRQEIANPHGTDSKAHALHRRGSRACAGVSPRRGLGCRAARVVP